MNFYSFHIGDYATHTAGRWRSYELPLSGGPRWAGVYAIYFGSELVYIGSSSDIASRLSQHRFRYGYSKVVMTPWGDVPCSVGVTVKLKRSKRLGDWAMWEIRLIDRLNPVHNKQHARRARA